MLSIQRLQQKTYRALWLVSLLALTSPKVAAVIPAASQQLVVVTSPDWHSSVGTLQVFSRTADGPWQAQPRLRGDVALGRSGLAWGIGLHPEQTGVQKQEGDGKAPAGLFRLSGSFGAATNAPGAMPYLAMQSHHYCIDVPTSVLYNQTVDIRQYPKAMTTGSTEPMRRDLAAVPDDAYQQGLFIDHNPRNQPGAGSCIFMHQRLADKPATAGCTALPPTDLVALMQWLKPDLQPVYLLLPQAEYQARQQHWQLPELQP